MSFAGSPLKRVESGYFSVLGSSDSSSAPSAKEKNLQSLFEACIQSQQSTPVDPSVSLRGRVTPFSAGTFVCGQMQNLQGNTEYMIHRPPSRKDLSSDRILEGSTKTGLVGGEVWLTRENGEPLQRCSVPTITVKTNKGLKDGYQERLAREIQFLRMFEGARGIAQLIGSYHYEGSESIPRTVMVMPHYPKQLFSYLHPKEQLFHKLPLSKQRKLQLDLLNGLVAIHREGIVHRDIKPENLFVSETENSIEAVIGDFDRAISLSDEECFSAAGSPPYLAPEYRKATSLPEWQSAIRSDEIKKATTPCIDVWGMGVSFYQMLDLEKLKLKSAGNLVELSKNGRTGFTRPKNEDSFEYLVWKMLQINPQDRFTAEQALAKLSSIKENENRSNDLDLIEQLESNASITETEETTSSESVKQSKDVTECSCVVQ